MERAGCGLIVPPGDAPGMAKAVRLLAQDPEHGAALGQAGRAYLEAHFDRSRLAEQLVDILETMLEKHKSR